MKPIIVDYQLSPSWNKNADSIDFSAADVTALRYSLVLGDVTMFVNEHDFSARWGWIPIIDFAVSLRHIAAELAQDGSVETEYPFTESEAVIRFKRIDDDVVISASYVQYATQVSLVDFQNAVSAFTTRVAEEIGQRYPLLLRNKCYELFWHRKKCRTGVVRFLGV